MGTCQGGDSVIVANKKPKNKNADFEEKTNSRNEIEPDFGDPRFKDMPEWEGERYKGIGLKRMPGYKCTFPIDLLNEMRDDFWNFKIKEKPIWKHIRQACLMDELRANGILVQMKMTTADGMINHLIDEHDQHYFIPNYCINDPYFEKEFGDPPGRKINVVLYESFSNKNVNIEVDINTTGSELKVIFCKKCARVIWYTGKSNG